MTNQRPETSPVTERDPEDQLLEEISAHAGGALPEDLSMQLRTLTPADLADLIEASPAQSRQELWRSADDPERGEILLAVHGDVRDQLVEDADSDELLRALEHLQMDELADLEDELPEPIVAQLLDTMSTEERERFDVVRSFPDDTAGGLMDVDALAVSTELTLAGVHRHLQDVRKREGALPEHLDSVFATDARGRYVGRLLLTDVIALPPDTQVGSTLRADLEPIAVDLPADEVARRFEDQDLISAPVVDPDGRLVGRITIDDVVDVIRGEGEDAILGMAGLDRDVDPFGGVRAAVQRRLIWLGVHLVNGLVAAGVVALFSESIETLVALAVLMPVVAGFGGVGGTQSLTLVTRGLALGQVRSANAPRLLASEIVIAVINGVIWSLVVASLVYAWFGDLGLALVFAVALIFNLVNGAFFGTWLPLLLPKLGIDPAVAGGVLLIAATDVLGFAIFLGLATVVLL
ncbi:MAG TPA: magnesium transporter [Gammaproteobacteria bacterium]|nr:magnesium transporter [Gammaproteobacteria bacterium]